jgi:glycosyltransferase involved in cell wall biosynthesis
MSSDGSSQMGSPALQEAPVQVRTAGLLVSLQTSDETGGAEFANVDLLSALRGHGVDAQLMSNKPELAVGTGVPSIEIDLGPKLKRSTWARVGLELPYRLWQLDRALRRETRDRRLDALLLHFKKEQLMSILLSRRLAPTVVWAEWGPLPKPLARGPLRRLYALASRRAKLIVAVSESTRESLIDAGVPASKVVAIHNIVDGDEVRFDADARARNRRDWQVGEDAFVVGVVTRLSASKRNDVVIDSLAYLPANVTLVIAGEGDDEARLRERAAPYGDRVKFLPNPRGYVQEVLSACDVVAFAPQEQEGAPRAIIFGQLCERPVIATAPQGARGMVAPGTGSIVSPAHDARAVAACIEHYREQPTLCELEGAAGRVLAERRYGRDGVVEDWVRHLRELGATADD